MKLPDLSSPEQWSVAGCDEAAVQGQGYVDLGGYESSDEEDHHQQGSVWLRDQAD